MPPPPTVSTPLPLRFYRKMGSWGQPLLHLVLRHRLARGKEEATRLGERWGIPSQKRPPSALIWLHAASGGETISILPLIEALHAKGWAILLTTGTKTSAQLAASRLPQGVVHQFTPLDIPEVVARFLDHWRPSLALFCESELWPCLLNTAHQRQIPVGMVNARISEKSYKLWQFLPQTIAYLLKNCAFCLAQSEADAARYQSLGTPARMIGNLKLDSPPLPVDVDEKNQMEQKIGARAVFVAASTHQGEEEVILQAFKLLLVSFPDLLLILVPRHPHRGEVIADQTRKSGFNLACRSLEEQITPATNVYLADTIGELGLFYRLAQLAFIGGSLVAIGGHNPIEPLMLGTPILHGSQTYNFADSYENLQKTGGSYLVHDVDSLREAVADWLKHPEKRAASLDAAGSYLQANHGALPRTLQHIEDHMLRQGVTNPAAEGSLSEEA